jgi:hypothetical protein
MMKWLVDKDIVEIDPDDRAKLPPHDEDAEAAALGCIFLSPEACTPEIGKVGLDRRSFYMLTHQTIFDCIVRLAAEGKTPDLLTVAGRLRDDGMMEKAGGLGKLSALPDHSPTAMLFEQYAARLNVLRRRREIMQYASCLISRASDLSEPLDTLQDDLQRAISLADTRGDALPEIDDMAEFLAADIPEPPQLIYGVLYQGSKMVLGGGAKTHKTWTLTDLAVSVACGEPWFSLKTTRAKVLYVNFEMCKFSYQKRSRAICQSKNIKIPKGAIDVWNLRSYVASYTVLFPLILERIKKCNYGMIILDPIYKTYGPTDENAAGAVAMLMNGIEQIAAQTGAAVVFGAHYAKGNAASKEAIDRISGSGVFARDPDAIINVTKHEVDEAFTIEATLRDFKPLEPFVVRWIYPLMRRDEDLDPKRLRRANAPKRIDPLDLLAAIEDSTSESPVSVSKWATAAKVKRSTLYEYLPTMVTNGWVEVIGENSSARRYITEAGLSALNERNKPEQWN